MDGDSREKKVAGDEINQCKQLVLAITRSLHLTWLEPQRLTFASDYLFTVNAPLSVVSPVRRAEKSVEITIHRVECSPAHSTVQKMHFPKDAS